MERFMKKIKTSLSVLFLSLISLNAMAVEEQLVVQEKPLTLKERIDIKLEEKKRLRMTEDRRTNENRDLDFTYLFVDNLPYNDLTKSRFYESIYYLRLLKNERTSESIVKDEVENISWNALCLANTMEYAKFETTFNRLLSLEVKTEGEKSAYDKNNEILFLENKKGKFPTQEEISIRCIEMFKGVNSEEK
tara:strand:- start:190701 stop:191273 length:573 start_codon:yes stop_codon:yes gene_type:complete